MFFSKASSQQILKRGHAMRVIFYYPGEEGTYVDNIDVTLYQSGIVHIKGPQEECCTHIQNCEILWNFSTEGLTNGEGRPLRVVK